MSDDKIKILIAEEQKGIPTQYFDLKVHGHIVTVLKSKQDWISRIPRDLPSDHKRSDVLLWVDKFGMVLSTGEDFQAAEEAESYPVTVYRLTRLSDFLEAIRKEDEQGYYDPVTDGDDPRTMGLNNGI